MRLAASFAGKKNAFFGPTDQKLWMFEVSRRSLGRAGMCCSQWERVDHLRKKWRAGRKKMGTSRQVQASTYGRRATPGPVGLSQFFWIFFIFKKWIFGSLGNGPGLLEEWVYNAPIFWSLPLHLEVVILPKFMESGDFTFFQIFFFLNLVHTWTFISTVRIFVSWKN
jgi:hypothetical protein